MRFMSSGLAQADGYSTSASRASASARVRLRFSRASVERVARVENSV